MYFDRRQSLPPLLIIAALVGCESPTIGTSSGLTCVDDSPMCIERRQQTLSYLIDSEDRAWIKAHPPAEAYASGVRLFAFQRKRKQLSCEELALAHGEAERAPGILRGPEGAKLTPAQVSRGVILASEVARELAAEMKRRCKTKKT
jgi:hypothetical protein